MAVEIGRPPANCNEDPIRMMSDCHRRIERFLYVLVTIKRQAQGGVLTQEQSRALESALYYFRESAPWHTLDEEESLYPRMRLLRQPLTEPTLENLVGLEFEHAVLQVCHKELDTLGRKWLQHGSLEHDDFLQFAEMLKKVSLVYHRHIHEEETQVFPLAVRMLREPDIRAIGREMAARREVPFIREMLAST